jgi:hypothetical protein
MMAQPKINRRGWLAMWLQKRRRERALILSSDGHGHLTWISNVVTVCGFNIYRSDDGINWSYYDTQYPDLLYRDCSGQSGFFRISGADDDGNPILPYSNVVYSDGLPLSTPGLDAPTLVSLGKVLSETTWRAVAPVAVNGWQFCTTDTPFDPAVKNFDQWVADADSPDTEFDTVNATTATVTVDFAFCAARYLVGATWSRWTGVVTNLGYGLVAHFAFDEVSGDRSDNVGGYALRGFDCTINSAPGLFGRGALFNRSGFLQGIDETTLFSPSPSGLTVSIWVNLDGIYDSGSDVRIVSLWNDSGWPANSSWAIWSGTPEEANITAMVMGTGYTHLEGEANFSGWNHICLVYEPVQSVWTLYFNGAVVSSANFGYAPVSGKLGVGANANCQDATPQGVFDELAIWSRPLSAGEIALLYNNGAGRAYPY